MGLTLEIRDMLSRGSTIQAAKTRAAAWKHGTALDNYYRWIEIFYVEERLKAGDSPDRILSYIRQNQSEFTRNWTLAKIHKIRVKLSHGISSADQQPASQDRSSNPFDIDPKRGFGVEIEMLCRLSMRELSAKLNAANITTSVENRNYRNYRHHEWKITEDGSLNRGGMELVSPILKGKEGLEQLIKVCQVLKENRAKIDVSCGLHIHHQVSCHGVDDLKIMQNAIFVYNKYQDDFNKMLPKSRRFHHTCHPYSKREIQSALTSSTTEDLSHNLGRYKSVNVQSYIRHGTCEFRQHSGSIEAEKINNWVIITQAVMIKAIELARTSSDITAYQFKKQMMEELALKQEVRDYIKRRAEALEKAA